MVFMPVASLAYEPKLAAVWLLAADTIASSSMLPDAVRRCVWREVLPLAAGAIAAIPFGVILLVVADADAIRWIICAVILIVVALMAQGWRYKSRLGPAATLGTGALAGLSGGTTGLSGPPVVLLWLGGQGNAATVRANLVAFFFITAMAMAAAYWWQDLLTGESLSGAILLTIAYWLPLWIGSHLFRRSSEQQFRYAALALCAFAAIAGLPLWRSL